MTLELHASFDWRATSPNTHHQSLSLTTFSRNLRTTGYTSVLNDFYTIADVPFRTYNSIPAPTGELRLQTRIKIAFSNESLRVLEVNVLAACATSLGISLGRSFYIRVQAFRLAARVIRLTILQQYTTFGRQPRGSVHEALSR